MILCVLIIAKKLVFNNKFHFRQKLALNLTYQLNEKIASDIDDLELEPEVGEEFSRKIDGFNLEK